MIEDTNTQVDANNRWRLETPGHEGWKRTARAGDPNKYLMISADCHANEPSGLWLERIDKKYHNRLPRIETDENGVKWVIAEGMQRSRMIDHQMTGEEAIRNKAGATPEQRIKDHLRDGIDAEIMFPNKGLSVWATTDAEFGAAQCKVWNDWAWETYGPYNDFMSPIAAIMTADINLAIEEIKRVAKLGYRGINLPCKPIFGAHDARHPNYNMAIFDPMWEVDPGLRHHDHVPYFDRARPARGAQGRRRDHQLCRACVIANSRADRVPVRLGRVWSVSRSCASPESSAASDGCRGRSRRWTKRPASITCGLSRSSRSCRASISASTARRRFRTIRSASNWPKSTTS